jgi:hypothetical protein
MYDGHVCMSAMLQASTCSWRQVLRRRRVRKLFSACSPSSCRASARRAALRSGTVRTATTSETSRSTPRTLRGAALRSPQHGRWSARRTVRQHARTHAFNQSINHYFIYYICYNYRKLIMADFRFGLMGFYGLLPPWVLRERHLN